MLDKYKCPKCKKYFLLWHMIQGIRLLRQVGKKLYYDVRCPVCGDFTIEAKNR